MKIILFILLFVQRIDNNKISVKDSITGEDLSGVKITNIETNEIYYTDFDSYSNISDGKYQIEYISYNKFDTINIKNDTIIYLERKK